MTLLSMESDWLGRCTLNNLIARVLGVALTALGLSSHHGDSFAGSRRVESGSKNVA